MKETGILKEQDKLTQEESELLNNYNKLSGNEKESFLNLVKNLTCEDSTDGKNK